MGDAAEHDNGSFSSGGRPMPGAPFEPVGRFYAWWRGDPLPPLSPVPDVAMSPSSDEALVATVTGIEIEAVRERMDLGHRPWLARIGNEPAGWGWVASREAGIAELDIAITLPLGERYLWDFVTVPKRRGRGVYSALLRTILTQEGADRYWIGHDEGNTASARGVAKVGFREVGAVLRTEDGQMTFVPESPTDRAGAAAALLGLPVINP